MIRSALLLLALAGCVSGEPFEPSTCPNVIVFMTIDTTNATLVHDSTAVPDSTTPGCEE
ncbi:MAG: hypothetical protein AAF389_14905 [Gemmatimonadota bacterium]